MGARSAIACCYWFSGFVWLAKTEQSLIQACGAMLHGCPSALAMYQTIHSFEHQGQGPRRKQGIMIGANSMHSFVFQRLQIQARGCLRVGIISEYCKSEQLLDGEALTARHHSDCEREEDQLARPIALDSVVVGSVWPRS